MKVRHAAALALVGWYLITASDGNMILALSFDPPVASFDTANECKQAAASLLAQKEDCDKMAANTVQYLKQNPSDPDRFTIWNKAADTILACKPNLKPICIATDDPRLKLDSGSN